VIFLKKREALKGVPAWWYGVLGAALGKVWLKSSYGKLQHYS
jgi:hypothetical protein